MYYFIRIMLTNYNMEDMYLFKFYYIVGLINYVYTHKTGYTHKLHDLPTL